MNVSQNVASVPAQSAALMHAIPAPTGGRRQYDGDAVVSQAYPPVHSAELVQPLVVQ
jgi:hypothetical protein